MPKNHRAVRPIDGKTAAAEPKPLDPVADFDTPVKKEQADLPGMENRAIDELESAARRYAAIRDKRMALNDAETKLQDLLMGLLKKYEKREYKRDGIEIWIKVEEEKVKVRVKDEDESPSDRRKSAVSDKQDSGRTDSRSRSEAQGDGGTSPQTEGESGQIGSEDRPAKGEGADDF